nr:hypothetical protein [Ferrimicrobium acidiphilum]
MDLLFSTGDLRAALRQAHHPPQEEAHPEGKQQVGRHGRVEGGARQGGERGADRRSGPGVSFLVQKLRALGVRHTFMLTGDNRTNV